MTNELRTKRELQNRVTLTFSSDRGREYLYDDVTGSIFPWNMLRETVLSLDLSETFSEHRKSLIAQFGESDVDAAHRFVRHWRERYGAFVRSWKKSDWVSCPPPDQLEQYIRMRSLDLLLILTENCNLRCKYCVLSEVYPLNRVRSTRRMSLDTAKRAIDWYFRLVEPQFARNPRKLFGLSFYGGEPLVNMPVLKGVLEYCQEKYPGIFMPVITTNGTLLTPKNVEILAKYNVLLAISLDGPEQEHDRLRVDANGRGSFSRIIRNIRRIKDDYPEYWASKVTSVSVYDWGTNLDLVEKFFNENKDLIPRSFFANQVGYFNTAWYKQYTRDDYNRMSESKERIRQRYKKAKIENRPISDYMNCLTGMEISLVQARTRAYDARPSFIPFSGMCVPGDKIAVHVDGKIDMCERVNGSNPIGHLDEGGIDYGLLKEIIDRYQRQVLFTCPQCPVTKLCNVCLSFVESKADFAKVPELCHATIESAEQRLADYVSILEENPQANLSFETENARLEERILFNF